MIGLSTLVFPYSKWMEGFNRTGFKCVEINAKRSEVTNDFRQARENIKPWSTYYQSSLYTMAGPLFSTNKHLRASEEQRLFGEVELCERIGARELVLNFSKQDFHKRTTSKFLKALNRRAVFNGVQLLVENNDGGRFSDAVDLDFSINQSKGIRACLNLDNLQKTRGDPLEFIKPLNTKIKYVRLSSEASPGIIKQVINECSVLKWIIIDEDFGNAMETLKTLTGLGVEL